MSHEVPIKRQALEGAGSEVVVSQDDVDPAVELPIRLGIYPHGDAATAMQPPTSKIRSKYHHFALIDAMVQGVETGRVRSPCCSKSKHVLTSHPTMIRGAGL
jgi:hypothetical protein